MNSTYFITPIRPISRNTTATRKIRMTLDCMPGIFQPLRGIEQEIEMLPNKFDYADQQRIAKLEAENSALRAALEEYANPENWSDISIGDEYGFVNGTAFLKDEPTAWEIAKAALKLSAQENGEAINENRI